MAAYSLISNKYLDIWIFIGADRSVKLRWKCAVCRQGTYTGLTTVYHSDWGVDTDKPSKRCYRSLLVAFLHIEQHNPTIDVDKEIDKIRDQIQHSIIRLEDIVNNVSNGSVHTPRLKLKSPKYPEFVPRPTYGNRERKMRIGRRPRKFYGNCMRFTDE